MMRMKHMKFEKGFFERTAGEHIAINGAEPIMIDLVKERLDFAKSLGVRYTSNLREEDLVEKVSEYTNGRMAACVMEASGANFAIRAPQGNINVSSIPVP